MLNDISRVMKLVTGRVAKIMFPVSYYQKELHSINFKVNSSVPAIKVLWNVKILFMSKLAWIRYFTCINNIYTFNL